MYYYVYLLESLKDKSWYIGFTINLKRRLTEHNLQKSKATKPKIPYRLIYCEVYRDKRDAKGREKFLKSGSGRKFLRRQIKNYLQE